MNKKLILFVIGIIVALIGAMVMFEGSLFGERTSGISIVIVIIGIGLLGSSSYGLLKQ